MGYTTTFTGKFKCEPALNADQVAYLTRFSETRRMKRDEKIVETFADPLRVAVGLPVGEEGEFFVGDGENFGQNRDASVIDFNRAPSTQHHLWCDWSPSENGKHIAWSGGEKFYRYVQWIEYIQDSILNNWGVKLSGAVKWKGESPSDRGVIVIKNGSVEALENERYKEYCADQRHLREVKQQQKLLTTTISDAVSLKKSRKAKI